jgi:hypothetical protein
MVSDLDLDEFERIAAQADKHPNTRVPGQTERRRYWLAVKTGFNALRTAKRRKASVSLAPVKFGAKDVTTMPRDGAIIFRDLVGKLDVLRVECDRCGRKGQYRVDHLIEQYGIDSKLFDWEPEADSPRKKAGNLNDQCGARCPDLSKVV